MKVIRVDNYDDEGPRGTQRLIAGPNLSEDVAAAMASELNRSETRSHFDWFRAVADDVELYIFEP